VDPGSKVRDDVSIVGPNVSANTVDDGGYL
jgi:hypothetical protein